jgi:hypothetical protein
MAMLNNQRVIYGKFMNIIRWPHVTPHDDDRGIEESPISEDLPREL